MVTHGLASPPCQAGSPTSSRTEAAGIHPGTGCAFLPRLIKGGLAATANLSSQGRVAQRRTFPRGRGGQVRARIPHTFPQCATGEAALPHQTPSGGMEGSAHRSSHMEANTYLTHQGGGNKESTGSTERWGWARLPWGDGPREKANAKVGSGCSPHREAGGPQCA